MKDKSEVLFTLTEAEIREGLDFRGIFCKMSQKQTFFCKKKQNFAAYFNLKGSHNKFDARYFNMLRPHKELSIEFQDAI